MNINVSSSHSAGHVSFSLFPGFLAEEKMHKDQLVDRRLEVVLDESLLLPVGFIESESDELANVNIHALRKDGRNKNV